MKVLAAWLVLVAAVVAVVAVLAAWKSGGNAEPSGLYGTLRIPQSSSVLCARSAGDVLRRGTKKSC
jgi:hypothetical protein